VIRSACSFPHCLVPQVFGDRPRIFLRLLLRSPGLTRLRARANDGGDLPLEARIPQAVGRRAFAAVGCRVERRHGEADLPGFLLAPTPRKRCCVARASSSLARGNLFMAHRTGFTAKTLANALRHAGFAQVRVKRDGRFGLWAIAYRRQRTDEQLVKMEPALAAAH
jgi:hypothetical protein